MNDRHSSRVKVRTKEGFIYKSVCWSVKETLHDIMIMCHTGVEPLICHIEDTCSPWCGRDI